MAHKGQNAWNMLTYREAACYFAAIFALGFISGAGVVLVLVKL